MIVSFTKLDSYIASCCRLQLRYEELNAEEHLANLPTRTANAHKAGALRKKWDLIPNVHERSAVLERWPEMKSLLDDFPGVIERAHISLLIPGRVLRVHQDGLSPEGSPRPHFDMFNRTLRFHVPLVTNDEVLIYADRHLYRMARGECWMLHNMKFHSAANPHVSEQRYHLIFDVRPNAKTFALLDDADNDRGIFDPELFSKYWPDSEMR